MVKGLAISYSCEKSYYVEIDDALLNDDKVIFYKATRPMTMACLANKCIPNESKARLAGHVASGTRMTEAELSVFKLPTCPRVKLDATQSPEPQKTWAGNADNGWCSFEVKPSLGLGMSGNAALHDLVRVQMHFPPINYPDHWSETKPTLSKKGAKPLEFKDLLSAQGNKMMGELLDAYANGRLKRMDFQVQEAHKPAPGALWKGQSRVQRRAERRQGHLAAEDEGGDKIAGGDGASAAAAAGCGVTRKKQKLQAELGGPCTRAMTAAAVAAAASEDAASA